MKYVVANWKAQKNVAEVDSWIQEFSPVVAEDIEVIIAPPYPFVPLIPQDWKVAVQDISPYAAGSYTGAVAARNLEGLEVAYAIVGHSERRRYFGETSQDVAQKVDQCLQNKITPIVCIDTEYLGEQASAIDDEYRSQCLVAYEPLAAIGSGNNASPEKVVEVRDRIGELFETAPVLYGGSVSPVNVTDYLEICEGVLVGTASLAGSEFAKLVSVASGAA